MARQRTRSPSSCQLAPSALPYEHGGFNPHPTYGFSARHLSVIHPLRYTLAERRYVSLPLIWTGPDWLISSSDPAALSNGQRERVSEIWGGDGIGCIAFLHSEHEEWRRKGVFALPAPSVHFLAHVGHFAGRADITATRCAPLWSQPATLSPRTPFLECRIGRPLWPIGSPSRTLSSTG